MSLTQVGYTYRGSLSGDEVIVGDPTTGSFAPQLTFTRWSKEASFKVGALAMTGTKTLAFQNNVVSYSNTRYALRYYQKDETTFEFEVVFKVKPTIYSISLPIQSTNLRFTYQDSLIVELKGRESEFDTITETQAWKNGRLMIDRPPNVVDSYAVYHINKKNNQYESGKAFHIYRPQLTDALGKKEWASININGSTLTLTVPKAYMDATTYPVTLDPTFGKTTQGGTGFYMDGGYMKGSKYTLTEAGTVTEIHALFYNSVNTGTAGLYDDDGAGAFAATRKTYLAVAINTAIGETVFDVPDVLLTADPWWIMASIVGADTYGYYDASAGTDCWEQKSGAMWPASMGAPDSHADWDMSIHAVYTAAGGGMTVPVAFHHLKSMNNAHVTD